MMENRTALENGAIGRETPIDDSIDVTMGEQHGDDQVPISEAIRMTTILTVRGDDEARTSASERLHSLLNEHRSPQETGRDSNADNDANHTSSAQCFTDATAILQHSYFELFCGSNEVQESRYRKPPRLLPDDPTIQESIECVFASQLQEGLPHMLLEEDGEDADDIPGEQHLVAPSVLQQSLFRSRSNSSFPTRRPSPKLRKRRFHSKLVHVRTLDSASINLVDEVGEAAADLQQQKWSPAGTIQCACCRQTRPILSPEGWPQKPLLLRPTPGSGTRIKGIRFAGSSDYLWEARMSTLEWPKTLRAHWGQEPVQPDIVNPLDVMCHECMVLPINNGNEAPEETLVTDFATDLFEGTLLLRLRGTEGTTPAPYDDSKGYFAGMNRRYQVVIQGRFKKEIPWTDCTTGIQLERRCGRLPARWIVNGAVKVIGFFAPQLDANLDSDKPVSLTPLGSTPQCIIVEDNTRAVPVEILLEEPIEATKTLLGKASNASSSMQRARFRKKAFDKLYAQKSPQPTTDPSKIYTFEFLQHLFNFQSFSIELGSMIGSVELKEILDGQPMQIMATLGSQRIWAFDIWHEVLLEAAQFHDEQRDRHHDELAG